MIVYILLYGDNLCGDTFQSVHASKASAIRAILEFKNRTAFNFYNNRIVYGKKDMPLKCIDDITWSILPQELQ